MSDNLNEQIAERLGWKLKDGSQVAWVCDGVPGYRIVTDAINQLPKWTADRNAIANDLLPRLTEEQWNSFMDELLQWHTNPELGHSAYDAMNRALTATPEQLCRAWLHATEESK